MVVRLAFANHEIGVLLTILGKLGMDAGDDGEGRVFAVNSLDESLNALGRTLNFNVHPVGIVQDVAVQTLFVS